MHMFISTMLRMLSMFIYISSTIALSNKTLPLALQILEMKRLTWAYVGTSDHNLKLNLPTWNNLLQLLYSIIITYGWKQYIRVSTEALFILPGTHTAFFIPNRQVSPPKPGCRASLGDLCEEASSLVRMRSQAYGQSAPRSPPTECPSDLICPAWLGLLRLHRVGTSTFIEFIVLDLNLKLHLLAQIWHWNFCFQRAEFSQIFPFNLSWNIFVKLTRYQLFWRNEHGSSF